MTDVTITLRATFGKVVLSRCLHVGNETGSPLRTQMSSSRLNLEGSPAAAAPDYSPDRHPDPTCDEAFNAA